MWDDNGRFFWFFPVGQILGEEGGLLLSFFLKG